MSILSTTVAMVTGASSGIGEATARRLADDGASLALLGRRRDRLEELATSLRAGGTQALVVEADVTSQLAAAGAVDAVIAEFGRLDILVNNAGLMLPGPVVDAAPEEWDRMIAVNLNGVLYMTKAALPHVIDAAETSARRVADLVNISSTGGRLARSGTAVYSLTKFGVTAFSEGLRQEVMGQRVRVGLVEPGTVATELSSHARDGVREGIQQMVTAFEVLRPEDIADAVSYMVTRDRRVSVNEMLVRASAQTW
ncbi:SDR family oxidoreductase [Glaciihabitans sp. dw_435]|uniref:SDR family oxidoreductase n=1 Tax=Glaciihabitans sp. dw_435 TaxID=2720081 RepID=UPI001BD5E515|nr:SDR family NAD(P)-dependent oxidoreductase [Glaciihabitans sp. dw_435]